MATAHAKPHHDYHLVNPSPWPAVGATSAFVVAVGLILWMHQMVTYAPLVFGAGAIGGYLGVQFAGAGADVSLVARGAHLAAMRANGLKLLIGDEERVVHPRCTDNAAELPPT